MYIPSGYLRLFTVIYGYGYLRLFTVIYGYSRLFTVIYGYLRLFTNVHHIRLFTVTHCTCDENFFNCLKTVARKYPKEKSDANMIGDLFFGGVSLQNRE